MFTFPPPLPRACLNLFLHLISITGALCLKKKLLCTVVTGAKPCTFDQSSMKAVVKLEQVLTDKDSLDEAEALTRGALNHLSIARRSNPSNITSTSVRGETWNVKMT